MPEEKTGDTSFFEDLAKNQEPENILDLPIEQISPPKQPDKGDGEEKSQELKNRRERRLAAKLQNEREANIALTERLKAISEYKNPQEVSKSEEEDFLKMVDPIYGTATPEAKAATELLKQALKSVYERASGNISQIREEIKRELEESSKADEESQKREEETLESIEEHLEDSHGLDFSDKETRQGYYSLLEKLSPKDGEGNILEYADPDTVAELYISQKGKKESRAKELAARSLAPSADSFQKPIEDQTWNILRNTGIF